MAEKIKYNINVGMIKSLKNTAVIIGIPALLFLIDNWTEWIPTEYSSIAFPIFGFLSYMVKNYIENR